MKLAPYRHFEIACHFFKFKGKVINGRFPIRRVHICYVYRIAKYTNRTESILVLFYILGKMTGNLSESQIRLFSFGAQNCKQYLTLKYLKSREKN